MNRQEEWDERQLLIARYLTHHLRHPTFEATDCDWGRTVGWRCGCGEEGAEADVPASWYNAVARFKYAAWSDYSDARAERAREWSRSAAAQMRARWHARQPSPEQREAEVEAEKKANELLRRFLSKKQLEQLDALGYFEQVGGDGNLYRLWSGSHRSIELVEGDEVTKTLCIHPKIVVPASDTLLAQKLLVQGDIVRLYKTANVTPTRRR